MTVVLIMASGQSNRMGRNKLLLPFKDSTVIETVVDFFSEQAEVDRILVVSTSQEIKELLATRVEVIDGGEERQDSVMNGLLELNPDDYVLIHDGARPFLSQTAFNRCLEQVKKRQAFCLAVPVTDTLKWVRDGALTTPDRSEFFAAQTPQGAVVGDLVEAYRQAKDKNQALTDDASALELAGYSVVLVEGEYSNHKLTNPQDMRYLCESDKE